jgi:hypothetical protein
MGAVKQTKEAVQNTGRMLKLTSYYAGRMLALTWAAVPGAAAAAGIVNAGYRVFRGHDVVPEFLIDAHERIDPLLQDSNPASPGGRCGSGSGYYRGRCG